MHKFDELALDTEQLGDREHTLSQLDTLLKTVSPAIQHTDLSWLQLQDDRCICGEQLYL